MYNILDYRSLQNTRFDGTAWNVFYEFGLGDEWWGHDGEYADELDAWFLTLEEALEFADECYPDEVLIEKLAGSPDTGGADKIMLSIESREWVAGCEEFDGDEAYFVLLEKDDDGISIERQMP